MDAKTVKQHVIYHLMWEAQQLMHAHDVRDHLDQAVRDLVLTASAIHMRTIIDFFRLTKAPHGSDVLACDIDSGFGQRLTSCTWKAIRDDVGYEVAHLGENRARARDRKTKTAWLDTKTVQDIAECVRDFVAGPDVRDLYRGIVITDRTPIEIDDVIARVEQFKTRKKQDPTSSGSY